METNRSSQLLRRVEEALASHPFVVSAVVERQGSTNRVHAAVCLDPRAVVSLEDLLSRASSAVRPELIAIDVTFVSSPSRLTKCRGSEKISRTD